MLLILKKWFYSEKGERKEKRKEHKRLSISKGFGWTKEGTSEGGDAIFSKTDRSVSVPAEIVKISIPSPFS